MDDKVSIVVPVYNAAKYIDRCVSSVLVQTYPHWELLLIDDGSTDGSATTIDRYGDDPRIKVHHQANAGASAARNCGLDIASGRWVTFVDADDHISPDYLRHLVENARDCDIVIEGWNINGEDVRLEPCVLEGADRESVMHWPANLGYVCSKLFSRNLLEEHKLRFAKGVCWSEDLMLMLDVLQHAHRVRICGDVDYFYEQHAGSSIMRINSYERELAGYREACRLVDQLCESVTPDAWRYFSPYAFLWRTLRAICNEHSDRAERLRLMRQLPRSPRPLHNIPTHWKESCISWLVRHRCWSLLERLMRRIYN